MPLPVARLPHVAVKQLPSAAASCVVRRLSATDCQWTDWTSVLQGAAATTAEAGNLHHRRLLATLASCRRVLESDVEEMVSAGEFDSASQWHCCLSGQMSRCGCVIFTAMNKKGNALRSIGVGCSSPCQGRWARRWIDHWVCDAWPVRRQTYGHLPSYTERHCPLAGTKLYCLVTEAHGCEQLAQSCCLVADWPGVELATFRSRANVLTTEPPSQELVMNKLSVYSSKSVNHVQRVLLLGKRFRLFLHISPWHGLSVCYSSSVTLMHPA